VSDQSPPNQEDQLSWCVARIEQLELENGFLEGQRDLANRQRFAADQRIEELKRELSEANEDDRCSDPDCWCQ